jgi:hypothetical protein
MYPTFATNPIEQKYGLDDTFRYTPLWTNGSPIGPETTITVTSVISNSFYIYRDVGLPLGAGSFGWGGTTNGGTDIAWTNVAGIPEGTKCYMTRVGADPGGPGNQWVGWGIFQTNVYANMYAYKNGTLSFSLKSTQNSKIEIEGPQYTKNFYMVPSTTGNWLTVNIPLTNFPSVNFSNIYAYFENTVTNIATNYIDDVRWTK